MNIQHLCLNCFAERRPESACGQCGWHGKADEVDGQLAPGSVLQNRYVVGQPLGRGGFSITYRGWDTRLQRLRAIKEYFPAGVVTREGSQSRISIVSGQSGLYSDGIQKYLAEARVLARFEGHPCIVFPTDFFEENSTAYLVMEYLRGETLRQYVTRHGGRIPYEHAVYFLTPVLRALATVHDAGMLHRDVSPDNVFLTVDSETKLLDFGAARQRMGGQPAAMTVIIREHYAPPEQYSETGKQGTWTDIYAFAATFYYAITGDSPPSALARLMNDEIQRPSELGAVVPLGAEAMLMRALAIQPKDRPQRIDEVLHALLAPPQPIVAAVEPVAVEPAPSAEAQSAGEPLSEPAVAAPEIHAVSPPVEAAPIVAEEPHSVTRPSRTGEREPAAEPSFLQSALETVREERLWRVPVFLAVAAGVALATYAVLERISPRTPDVPPAVSAPAAVPAAPVPVPSPAPPAVVSAPSVPVTAPTPVTSPSPAAPPTPIALAPGAPAPVSVPDAPVPPIATAPVQSPSPVVVASPRPVATKPPSAPIAKPANPTTAATPVSKPTPSHREEVAAVFSEGRELVRSKVRADRKRGYELVAYAAEGGLPEAELLLGSLYVDGIPNVQKPDEAAALGWYRKAAAHGEPRARFELARRLELGMWENKVERPDECAWYVPFCKADAPQAQTPAKTSVDPEKDLLAWLRSQSPGKGSPAELKEALALYKGLAEQGRADAEERVGYMLVAGNGIEANRFDGFLWFLRSARHGNPSAQYVVGKMYAKGEGIAANDDAAVCWLSKAAAGKIAPARRALVALGKASATGDLPPAPRECRFKPLED